MNKYVKMFPVSITLFALYFSQYFVTNIANYIVGYSLAFMFGYTIVGFYIAKKDISYVFWYFLNITIYCMAILVIILMFIGVIMV